MTYRIISALKSLLLALFVTSCSQENALTSSLIALPEVFGSCSKGTVPDSAKWYLDNKTGIDLAGALVLTSGSPLVSIGVADRAFNIAIPSFKAPSCMLNYQYVNFWGKDPPLSAGHGSAVASLIADCPTNPFGLVGINNSSNLVLLEVKDSAYQPVLWALGYYSCVNKTGVNGCGPNNNRTNPLNVINVSLGTNNISQSDPSYGTLLLQYAEMPKAAAAVGSIIVAAAGNEAKNANTLFPAGIPGVITVGATGKNGKAADFSNWGDSVEIMAPGVDIPVAQESGWCAVEGTSYSAPIVSAVISLMKSVYPELNWKTALYFMQETATPLSCDEYCPSFASPLSRSKCRADCCTSSNNIQTCTPGRLNAGAAVGLAQLTARTSLADGVPVSLIDSNIYAARLFQNMAEFKLVNRGGAAGTYTISSVGGKLKLNLSEITLAPGQKTTLIVQPTSLWQVGEWSQITIKSPRSGVSSNFSDELSLYVVKE